MIVDARPDLRTLTEQVYGVLRDRILNGEVTVGERIDVNQTCESLGVSPTPVREALTRLSTEGLVRIIPRRGTFVTEFSLQDLEELFEIRRMIELHAVERALENATAENDKDLDEIVARLRSHIHENGFLDYRTYLQRDHDLHSYLVQLSGNERLSEMFGEIRLNLHLARASVSREVGDAQRAHSEHQEVVAAFKERSLPRLRSAIEQHEKRRFEYLSQMF